MTLLLGQPTAFESTLQIKIGKEMPKVSLRFTCIILIIREMFYNLTRISTLLLMHLFI